MSSLRLNSNISSLQAQRSLRQVSDAIGRSFERLSTGLRINRASDDAAGLSIASSLQANARIYSRAVLNINDGMSALSIAEGGLREGSNIATRLKELAVQAANGSLSRSQRRSLDQEADRLVEEFNRIAATTIFNGRSLLQSGGDISIQAGIGANGSIGFVINNQLSRNKGTSQFTESTLSAGQYQAGNVADLNKDGKLDLLTLTNNGFRIRLGNGDGTFGSETYYNLGQSVGHSAVGDFNGDGNVDVVLNHGANSYRTYTGNGDGTFTIAANSTGIGFGYNPTTVGDMNGDGRDDLVFTNTGDSSVSVMLSNGNGTFATAQNYQLGFAVGDYAKVELGDFNGDGRLDALTTAGVLGSVALQFGNGQGGLGGASIVANTGTSIWARGVTSGDFNDDGLLDFAVTTAQDYTIRSYINQGNGTFTLGSAQVAASGSAAIYADAVDMNGDNILDLLTSDINSETGFGILLGNGDGTFQARTFINTGINGYAIAGDFNGDGVNDAYVPDALTSNTLKIYLQSVSQTTELQLVHLNTRDQALASLSIIDAFQQRISKELGAIGSFQSRLFTARNALESQRDEFLAAEGRIRDVDVAVESANLVRLKILQEAASSVLAAANQQPALVLTLLK